MSNVKTIAATIHKLAKPDIKPKELMALVRKKHPDATKKQIVRAAFFCLIQDIDNDVEKSKYLHTFALSERSGDDMDDVTSQNLEKLRKSDKKAHKLRTIKY
ncbi:hypothetical protein [Methylobacterium platani]|uniref:hypothetical protein n=1 Tax=Methylobacterium platani TaxID=427683 RepID=UPI000ABE4FE5|nr:hypothetical protein [Methylobacterium platani]